MNGLEVIHVGDYLAGLDHFCEQGFLICIFRLVFCVLPAAIGMEFLKIAFETAAISEKLVEGVGDFRGMAFVLSQRRFLGWYLGKQIGFYLFLKIGHGELL